MSIYTIDNWINGAEQKPLDNQYYPKFNPHTGEQISSFAGSRIEDVDVAVSSSTKAFREWSEFTAVGRGDMLYHVVNMMKSERERLAECVSRETGKSLKDANNEVSGAIRLGEFFAGEGMRLFGTTYTSSVKGKTVYSQRYPLGVAGLIVPANTPIANIAWKVFPALICGNCVVLKSSEDAPHIANIFAEICTKSGIPPGVFNVIHGLGEYAGEGLVSHRDISLISFTGSTRVGKIISKKASDRMARISLELGGKNPLIVCQDADLEWAVHCAVLSAFSNAGQRCSAASRILIHSSIYSEFKQKMVDKTKMLKLGIDEYSDVGPLINQKHLSEVASLISSLPRENILIGGNLPANTCGFYFSPTIIENIDIDHYISQYELFAPITTLYSFDSNEDAVLLANNSKYGLTSAVHTQSIPTAMFFVDRIKSGVVNVNSFTFGSEPHLPFGGFGDSGNGTREPGTDAIEVYSEKKIVSILRT